MRKTCSGASFSVLIIHIEVVTDITKATSLTCGLLARMTWIWNLVISTWVYACAGYGGESSCIPSHLLHQSLHFSFI